ncbi:spike base protein, RCAP_Rcc01079 family [Sphingobium sp. AntQ-1]|uniref:spike base protein, RCAP_Rcc01079 family n=1 Tax=Sphingobium sp. AntQ-1 TaxID=2930091 RepID=UPI003FA6DDBB
MADMAIRTTSSAGPGRALRAVTPHASNELPDGPCRALKIGGAGNISIVARDDAAPVTLAVSAGELLPIQAKAVRVSGTTATGIVAIY